MAAYPVANIDLVALQHNLQRVKQLAPNSRIMSVIKANAYGHGLIQVAHALDNSDAFAVARLSEAMRMRQQGIQKPIVLLEGVATLADLQTVSDNAISVVFHHLSQIELLNQIALTNPLSFCWLMVETGMHRLGVTRDQVANALHALTTSVNISGSIGLMSHFANADLVGDVRNQQQLDNLTSCLGSTPTPVCMANSAAILSIPDAHADWIRPGLMLYGVSPFEDKSAKDLALQPVMQLKSVLTAIKNLQKGDQIGYGGEWVATQSSRVGIVSIGYGDGYNRHLSAKGTVIINEIKVAVLGRVSMDMICIDLQACPEARIGDEVILWGCEDLTVEQVAQAADTIPYELLCQISERVDREYHHG